VLVLCHWAEDLSWLNAQPFRAVVYEKKRPQRSSAACNSTALDRRSILPHGDGSGSDGSQDDGSRGDDSRGVAAALNRFAAHRVQRNVAGEASAFLTFIVDYYDTLPPRMVFLHRSAARATWGCGLARAFGVAAAAAAAAAAVVVVVVVVVVVACWQEC
jgi:hypothetical protein